MIDNFRINQNRIAYLSITLFMILLTVLCFSRHTIGYGIETDFLGEFVPEAIRLLNGNPLELNYHPPFYSISLAIMFLIFKDWVISGMILSLMSAFLFLIMSYHFVKLIIGDKEAIGAILAVFLSWGFISYSVQSSSDMFFFALFYCGLASIALAEKKQRISLWIISGIFTGLTFLTRSNGIPVLFFLLFAVVSKIRSLPKKKIVLAMVFGMIAPIILWSIFAKISDSPIYVQSNYKNLALSYFAKNDDRTSADATRESSQEFSNIWQVLSKNPKHILFRYGKDLLINIKRFFQYDKLIVFPFNLLAFPALILLFFSNSSKFKIVLLFNLLSMSLFLNLHAWQYRFYLFMVPIIGAGIVNLLDHMQMAFKIRPNPKLFIIIIPILILFFLTTAIPGYVGLKRSEALDSLEASKALITGENPEINVIVSRKPHLSFYTGSKRAFFPNVQTVEELQASIKSMVFFHPEDSVIYLFYGFSERRFRSQFLLLISHDFKSPWLKKVRSGNENGGWVLYEIIREKL